MAIIEIKKETKARMIDELRRFYLAQLDQEISQFNAELLLDFMLDQIGPMIYNQAIEDAHHYCCEKAEDLLGLEKRVR